MDAIHCTAPYCAVKFVVAKLIVDPDRVPRVKDTVGAVLNPDVLQPENNVAVPLQKLFVTLALIVVESELYILLGLDK